MVWIVFRQVLGRKKKMKRNFADSSARSTAGCLPVLLFNQKKRNRQPLTSNPPQNEPGIGHPADNSDFSAMLADFGWETANPEPDQLQRTKSTDPADHPIPPSLLRHQNTPDSANISHGGSLNNWRQEEKSAAGRNIWKKQDFPAFGQGKENRKLSQFENHLGGFEGAMPQKLAGHPRASPSSKTGAAEQSYATAVQQPTAPNNIPRRGPPRQSATYTFKQNQCQPKVHTATRPEGKMIQQSLANQAKLKEKDSSLRIISVVIESMKHWSQYADKTPLLYEVLGVLDSAVTPGSYGAKTFLLRDGKESVSCVFYEIDRELPRLIRGRVHRCVGNYDPQRKVFKCVSVRPATVPEQQTFRDFVQVADREMGKYVKISNEV
uniref:Spermatogenesis-associated protein 22 n=1 Tax=Pogona vitticeps TaxID=103695 RepID=A0A6J0V2A3_9SAUR